MKVKKKDIQIVENDVIDSVGSYVEKVIIRKIEVYLYFEKVPRENIYKVFNISRESYQNIRRGSKVQDEEKECIGALTAGEDEKVLLCRLQNTNHIFENESQYNAKKAKLIMGGMALLGLLMVGIGFGKMEYNKVLLARAGSVEGEISSYSTARLNGRRYASGYYNVHVCYIVDGKKYEGYNGTTANTPKEGDRMIVHYDSKHPQRIIIEDKMNEYVFQFIYMGAIVFVVGLTLFISEIKQSKL